MLSLFFCPYLTPRPLQPRVALALAVAQVEGAKKQIGFIPTLLQAHLANGCSQNFQCAKRNIPVIY
jgi:hypothetical protein